MFLCKDQSLSRDCILAILKSVNHKKIQVIMVNDHGTVSHLKIHRIKSPEIGNEFDGPQTAITEPCPASIHKNKRLPAWKTLRCNSISRYELGIILNFGLEMRSAVCTMKLISNSFDHNREHCPIAYHSVVSRRNRIKIG